MSAESEQTVVKEAVVKELHHRLYTHGLTGRQSRPYRLLGFGSTTDPNFINLENTLVFFQGGELNKSLILQFDQKLSTRLPLQTT